MNFAQQVFDKFGWIPARTWDERKPGSVLVINEINDMGVECDTKLVIIGRLSDRELAEVEDFARTLGSRGKVTRDPYWYKAIAE